VLEADIVMKAEMLLHIKTVFSTRNTYCRTSTLDKFDPDVDGGTVFALT
jgi:hypothetical protein